MKQMTLIAYDIRYGRVAALKVAGQNSLADRLEKANHYIESVKKTESNVLYEKRPITTQNKLQVAQEARREAFQFIWDNRKRIVQQP